jgi:hypothetical protein
VNVIAGMKGKDEETVAEVLYLWESLDEQFKGDFENFDVSAIFQIWSICLKLGKLELFKKIGDILKSKCKGVFDF